MYKSIFLTLSFMFTTALCAQGIGSDLQRYYDGFENVPLVTGYLLNRSFINEEELDKFILGEGEESLSDRIIFTSPNDWISTYVNVSIAAINDDLRLPPLNDLYAEGEEVENNESSIGILNFDGDYIRPDSMNPYILPDSTLAADVPTEIINVFSMSNLENNVYVEEDMVVNYIFNSELVFTNKNDQFRRFEVDFGNGMGYQNISGLNENYSVTYETVGIKALNFRAYTNTDTLSSFSFIKVNLINEPSSTHLFGITDAGPVPIIFAEANIYLGCDGELDKPVILVPGFQVPGPSRASSVYGSYDENGIATYLRLNGYDVIAVGFVSTHLPIGFNARFLKQIISFVNDTKVGYYDNIIIGESMGGLVTRIALAEMERDSQKHDFGLYVSFDSPHNGSNIPLSIQETVHDAKNANANSILGGIALSLISPFGINSLIGTASDIAGITDDADLPARIIEDSINVITERELKDFTIDQAITANKSTSALQMAIRNRNEENEFSLANPAHLEFMQLLEQVGFPEGCRNITISNGSDHAVPQKTSLSEDAEDLEEGDRLVDKLSKKVEVYALVSFSDTLSAIVSRISKRGSRFGLSRLFFDVQEEGKYSFPEKSYDISPGSFQSGNRMFSFVPTASSIGLKRDVFNTEGSLSRYNEAANDPSKTRRYLVENKLVLFDDIYSISKNTAHIEFSMLDSYLGDRFKEREIMIDTYDLQNRVIHPGEVKFFHAQEILSVGYDVNTWKDDAKPKFMVSGNVVVETGAKGKLTAGEAVRLAPGFSVEQGGQLEARIVQTIDGCATEKYENTDIRLNKLVPLPEFIAVTNANGEAYLTLSKSGGYFTDEDYKWRLDSDGYSKVTTGKFAFYQNLLPGQYRAVCSVLDGEREYSGIVRIPEKRVKSGSAERESSFAKHDDINVFPQPAKNVINWHYDVALDVMMLDMNGRMVKSLRGVTRIDVKDLHPGMYSLILVDVRKGLMVTKKVVVQ
ncbi:T9SS type A sorting domain-containing protein [Neolewinella persica]|uniref:hypothetical protein n=1 Tax=Neolewinella persica TaxID=70998 RepID=UPI00039EF1EF|nr:hypothetical protein [Neolewinella persica]